jgi:hypothetical protein
MQEYHCHRNNRVVFCFHGNQVYLCCLDAECQRKLKQTYQAHTIMARVLEEDIYYRGRPAASGGLPRAQLGGSGRQQLQDSLYKLSHTYVCQTLDSRQQGYIERLREKKERVLQEWRNANAAQQAQAAQVADGHHHPPLPGREEGPVAAEASTGRDAGMEKLRDICSQGSCSQGLLARFFARKVPWRCVDGHCVLLLHAMPVYLRHGVFSILRVGCMPFEMISSCLGAC